MAYDTRELAVKIIGDASDFIKATDNVKSGSKEGQSSLEDFASGAKKASLVMAGVGVGLTAYAKSATDYTVNLVKSSKEISRETGVTVEQGSQLVYVAQRMGISADQASTVFGKFSKSITAAADEAKNAGQIHAELQNKIDKTKLEIQLTTAEIQKNGDKTGELRLKLQGLNTDLSGLNTKMSESTNAFGKLGINVLDANGKTKDFNTLLLESADKFKGMKDGSEKTALAMELFGRSGKDMLPVLNQGSKGIQDLEKQADKLGLTLNAKTIGSITRYIKSSKDLTDSQNALKVQIGTLTAPVLTSFNQKITSVTTALISAHNPFHTLTIDIIAFGGPIITAGAGLVNFTANLATSIQAIGGFRAAATALSVFMTGPWALAFAAVGLTLGVVAGHFLNNTSHAQDLAAAERALKTDTDALKDAQNNLANAQLGVEGAQLNVEQAQRNYNDAVSQFGPNSLEARQALHDLKQAQEDLKTAQDNAKTSLQELHDKQNEVAKDKTFIKHLQETRDNIQGVGRDAFDAGQQIKRLDGSKVTVKTAKNSTGTQVIDFTSTFGGGIGHNAQGTDYWQGGPTWINEQGPEIVDLPKGSRVYPASLSKKMSSGSGSSGGDVHFNVQIGMYAGMPVEKRQIALDMYKELVRAARSQGVSLPMIGAVGVQ